MEGIETESNENNNRLILPNKLSKCKFAQLASCLVELMKQKTGKAQQATATGAISRPAYAPSVPPAENAIDCTINTSDYAFCSDLYSNLNWNWNRNRNSNLARIGFELAKATTSQHVAIVTFFSLALKVPSKLILRCKLRETTCSTNLS